jgi:hypothetical protein
MFNDATSLLFYVSNLRNFVAKIRNVREVFITTVCPPGIDSLEDYSYLRSIHLSLKFIVTYDFQDDTGSPTSTFYMTFRYTLPYRKPSTFSSIEIFDSSYRTLRKFKVQPEQVMLDYINLFETGFKSIVEERSIALADVVASATTVTSHE